MSQTWTQNSYQADHQYQSDMQNIENNLISLKSSFSGSSAPSVSVVGGQLWFDTTNKILKVRNNANNAWLGVMYGNSNEKMYNYASSVNDGWTLYSSVSDCVLAIQGGSQAYNGGAGTTKGTWTTPAHTLTTNEIPSHNHGGVTGGQSQTHTHTSAIGTGAFGSQTHASSNTSFTGTQTLSDNGNASVDHTHTISDQGGSASHNHGASYRPYAAVGILQYPSA